MDTTYLYIITDGENAKVGKSDNPEKRLKELQTGNANHLSLVLTFPVPSDKVFSIEKQCHDELRLHFEKRGEWFKDVLLFEVRNTIFSIIESNLTLQID